MGTLRANSVTRLAPRLAQGRARGASVSPTADPKIGHFFAKTGLANFKDMLVQQVCVVSGGGCNYRGAKTKVAHEEHDIRMADFNRLVEDLQVSMDARGIPFATQNQLLARLAPMHRDIANTH
jgi:hemoglobin